MGGADEEWVVAAMSNDTMVVELLVRLHGEAPPPPPQVLSLEWTVRQRRSRPISVNAKKLAQSHRASPSTPLSWSGGTSLSGGSGGAGGGGSEESSRPLSQKLSSAARSKVCIRKQHYVPTYIHVGDAAVHAFLIDLNFF